ncbi:glycosyltransferase [Fontisphaera persica]|uniref:glycosyltransferase n=1 Tax=Fontisphaera persica TaxID=2974023 RepID=UPI0024C0D5A7|nr:glycosyltransferase [Fontisphaera persica]WCJ59712.1 glycosyltransferase [Fontisphaera persica]
MRVAILTNSISTAAGGMMDCVRMLSIKLCEMNGIDVEVLSIEDQFFTKNNIHWRPIQPRLFSAIGPSSFNYSPSLARYLRNNNFDIYHSHGLWQYIGVATSMQAKRAKKPHVVTPQGMLDPWALKNSNCKKRVAELIYEKRNMKNASCLHAVCESEYQSIRKYGLKNAVCIIPNGVELINDANHNSLITSLEKIIRKKKLLLYLSRIHPKKGLGNIIKAWHTVIGEKCKEEKWLLGIAGWDQGGYEDEIKRLSEDMGIRWSDAKPWGTVKQWQGNINTRFNPDGEGTSIVFLGPAFNEKKDALFRYSSAFILPSYSEGMPLAVLEAWSYGKPVIMTEACNLPEGFTAGAAIKVEPEPGSIAMGIRQLMEMSDKEREMMGQKGRRLVEQRFTWPKIAEEMKSVYDWLLGGGPPPNCVILS